MAWSKHSTTTNQWKSTSTGDDGANNAYDGAGGSVLEELMTFLATRGWTTSSAEYADSPIVGDTTWQHIIEKSVLCEDGTSVTMGYMFNYRERAGAADEFSLYLYNPATSTSGTQLFGVAASVAQPFDGKWSFWTSDQDSDSYLILASEGASNFCIGFWPPAGSLFAPGSNGTSWPTAFGIGPMMYGAGPAYESQAGAASQSLEFSFVAGLSTYNQGMSKVPFAMDFVYVSDPYDRPLFYTFGSDIQSYVQLAGTDNNIGPSNNSTHGVFALQLGTQYYLAVGDEQKLLLNTGTTPPAF